MLKRRSSSYFVLKKQQQQQSQQQGLRHTNQSWRLEQPTQTSKVPGSDRGRWFDQEDFDQNR